MKLSSYESPITGKTGNIFDVSDLWQKVLGVVVFVMIFIFGQKLADMIFPSFTTPATSTTPATKLMTYL
jgi:hypothetical protein